MCVSKKKLKYKEHFYVFALINNAGTYGKKNQINIQFFIFSCFLPALQLCNYDMHDPKTYLLYMYLQCVCRLMFVYSQR